MTDRNQERGRLHRAEAEVVQLRQIIGRGISAGIDDDIRRKLEMAIAGVHVAITEMAESGDISQHNVHRDARMIAVARRSEMVRA